MIKCVHEQKKSQQHSMQARNSKTSKKPMIADAGTTLASARCHTQKRVEHEWRPLVRKSGRVKKLSSSSTSLLQQHGASSPSSSSWSGIHQKRPNLMREHHRQTRRYTDLCSRWSSLMWYLAACQTWHKRGEHKRRLLRSEAASLGGTQNKLSR